MAEYRRMLKGREMIIPHIVFPIPMDSEPVWNNFKPWVEKFCQSMKSVEAGCQYRIEAIINERWGHIPKSDLWKMFLGLPVTFHRYQGSGCDVGGAQWFARRQSESLFTVNTTSRVYAWKNGWLGRLAEARDKHGPGLYGVHVSRERERLHLCCRCYGMETTHWNEYPFQVETRIEGSLFECGEYPPHKGEFNLLEWFQGKGLPAKVVYWNGVFEIGNGDEALAQPDIYRRGDQSNLLIKDYITDLWDTGTPEQRAGQERLCFNGK